MSGGWTAPELGSAMRRIGWLAIVALIGLEVDGRPLLRGPLALAIAVAAWSMAAAAPSEPIRRLLRASSAAAVIVAVASIAPWLDADRAGTALATAIASLVGGTTYSRAMSTWVSGPGVEWVTRRFDLAAAVQGGVAAALSAYVAAVVAFGSAADPAPGDQQLSAGGEAVDLSVLFGRSLGAGARALAGELALLAVLLVGAAGLYLMATANKAAQRSLRGAAIVDATPVAPGSDGAAPAAGEPGGAASP